LEVQERYLALLHLARRVRQDNNYPPESLNELIAAGEEELASLRASAGGRIEPRRRPTRGGKDVQPPYTAYVDECGSHILKAKGELDAFCLAAFVVPDTAYPALDLDWRDWKRQVLGAESKIVHEPDVRKGRGPFYFDGDPVRRGDAILSLGRKLRETQFSVIACVVNRPEYLKLHGHQALDESLPTHIYLMALHFLAERLTIALDKLFDGARARVVAESRGPLEDALLQYEYARLQLDGTSYVSAAFFRQQLCPGIEFRDKKQNETGLQLADLCARPCAEKVLDPASTPPRWPQVRQKLCPTQETANSILGLKVMPWDERYADICKAERATETAALPADQVKT
jgi:hypothetical protein